MRATALQLRGRANIEMRIDELRVHIDTTCLRTRATLDAQHAAVDAEIAALLACVRRLQVHVDGGSALSARRQFP
jgi:hypothetical protein